MSFKLMHEIIEEFDAAKTRAEKIAVLKKYDSKNLREFFVALFNSTVEFDVEIPTYRPAPEPAGLNYLYLETEIPKLYRFVKNHPNRPAQLTSKKQKELLLVMLESLHKDEADLLVRLIKKDLGIKFLTSNLVKEAYPGINI